MRKSSRPGRFSLKFCQAGPFLTEIFPGRAGLGRFSLIFSGLGCFSLKFSQSGPGRSGLKFFQGRVRGLTTLVQTPTR